MDGLETKVIVNQNQRVLVAALRGTDEGSRDISVHEPAGLRGRIMMSVVWQASGVCFNASIATIKASVREGGGRIGGD
eukprot:4304044-Pleurochrysis_carterae.AAC.1